MQFGTQFQERDAANGIHRTTEGVWLAISSAGGSPVLVMDMEGSDGRERGDDTCFENHISLFALVSADVLLISTWAKDVGRETGSGKTLLKNLLQVSSVATTVSCARTLDRCVEYLMIAHL